MGRLRANREVERPSASRMQRRLADRRQPCTRQFFVVPPLRSKCSLAELRAALGPAQRRADAARFVGANPPRTPANILGPYGYQASATSARASPLNPLNR